MVCSRRALLLASGGTCWADFWLRCNLQFLLPSRRTRTTGSKKRVNVESSMN